jgi:hypothetical protein
MKIRLFAVGVAFLALRGLGATASKPQAQPANEFARCELSSLPEGFRHTLEADFSSWKIQEPLNLSEHARKRWESEKPLSCPGIAIGQFENAGRVDYAVLVVPKDKPNSAYKLFVYSPILANPLQTVDEWDKGGAANNFIHTITISKVFSREWINKLEVRTRDGILAVDSGENEYEVDVYFWSKGQFRHEPIDY